MFDGAHPRGLTRGFFRTAGMMIMIAGTVFFPVVVVLVVRRTFLRPPLPACLSVTGPTNQVRRDAPADTPGALEGRNAIKETWQQELARSLGDR